MTRWVAIAADGTVAGEGATPLAAAARAPADARVLPATERLGLALASPSRSHKLRCRERDGRADVP